MEMASVHSLKNMSSDAITLSSADRSRDGMSMESFIDDESAPFLPSSG